MSAAAATCIVVALTGASAQTQPAPSTPASPAAVPTPAWCPLSTRVRDLDETHTRYAVSFRSLETGRASGTVALWAGDRRYDVAFHNVVALDTRDRISPETSITVRFSAPTVLDGAVVTALDDGSGSRPCEPWFAPWVPNAPQLPGRQMRQERTDEDRFLMRARAATPVDAPTPVTDPATCTTPYRLGRTVSAAVPGRPPTAPMSGFVVVLVLIDPSDKVVGARIQRSSGDKGLDNTALSAAQRSDFQGQIFRCRHVMGGYLFSVEFNA
jgi:TonB family protein